MTSTLHRNQGLQPPPDQGGLLADPGQLLGPLQERVIDTERGSHMRQPALAMQTHQGFG